MARGRALRVYRRLLLDRYDPIAALRSRLEKPPTDLRQSPRNLGDGTLVSDSLIARPRVGGAHCKKNPSRTLSQLGPTRHYSKLDLSNEPTDLDYPPLAHPGPSPDLEPLEKAGYELVYAPAGKTPTEGELLKLVPGCVGWLAGVEPISERVLRSATELKVISRNGTGVDNVRVDLAQQLGITVLRAEAANARGVAELAICLALASLRHLPSLHLTLKNGQWKPMRGREIRDRQFGLVGCGFIGRLVAQMVSGLGARVRAFDPYPDTSFQPSENFAWRPFDAVLASEPRSSACTARLPPVGDR